MTRTSDITRRSFVAGAGAAVFGPHVAWGQARAWRIAVVNATDPVTEMTVSGNSNVATVLRELGRLGLVEGQNLTVDRYSGGGRTDQYESLAYRIVATGPDLIFNSGSGVIGRALMAATSTIPIVFGINDALAQGFVTNMGRPGGNVTGAQATAGLEQEAKKLELLHEAVPAARRVGVPVDQVAWETTSGPIIRTAAERLGLVLAPSILSQPIGEAAYEQALAIVQRERADLLYVASTTANVTYSPLLGRWCAANRLPGIGNRAFVAEGGLMAYFAGDAGEYYVRAAGYVARILVNGERPGDLPVQQPDKFGLALNLKAAKALGLTLPGSILLQATEILE